MKAITTSLKTIDQFMIDTVKSLYGSNLSDKQLAGYLNYEYQTAYTEADVRKYFEPTIQEEVEDLTLVHEHTTGLKP